MEMKPVTSSNIAAVGYAEGSGELIVQYKGGGTYRYFDVPAEVHAGLAEAKSIGGYINENVKGKFSFARAGEKSGE
jgi:hypothetical protein